LTSFPTTMTPCPRPRAELTADSARALDRRAGLVSGRSPAAGHFGILVSVKGRRFLKKRAAPGRLPILQRALLARMGA
jgi:hypothetical protein